LVLELNFLVKTHEVKFVEFSSSKKFVKTFGANWQINRSVISRISSMKKFPKKFKKFVKTQGSKNHKFTKHENNV